MIRFIVEAVRWTWEAILTLICVVVVIFYFFITGFMSLWVCAAFFAPKEQPGTYFLAAFVFWFVVFGITGFYASGLADWLNNWYDRAYGKDALSCSINVVDSAEAARRAAKESY
jgi:hypothetical protein